MGGHKDVPAYSLNIVASILDGQMVIGRSLPLASLQYFPGTVNVLVLLEDLAHPGRIGPDLGLSARITPSDRVLEYFLNLGPVRADPPQNLAFSGLFLRNPSSDVNPQLHAAVHLVSLS